MFSTIYSQMKLYINSILIMLMKSKCNILFSFWHLFFSHLILSLQSTVIIYIIDVGWQKLFEVFTHPPPYYLNLVFYQTSIFWCRPAQEFFTWKAAKCWPMLGAQGLWAERDLYRAAPAATRALGFPGLI
jgi:hypothetical protein